MVRARGDGGGGAGAGAAQAHRTGAAPTVPARRAPAKLTNSPSPLLPTPFADDIKFAWKIQRDMAERGHSLANIKASIEARKPDFDAYIDPQKKKADVIIEVHTVGWMWVVFGARLCVSACLCVCRWRSGGRELSPCAAATANSQRRCTHGPSVIARTNTGCTSMQSSAVAASGSADAAGFM